MTEITALVATMKATAEKAKHAGEAQIMPFDTRVAALNEFQLAACPANVLALARALEKALRNETLTEAERQACLGLIRDRDAQITELESRTVTVKLPERYDVETYPLQSPKGEWYSRDDVLTMLAAAGIQVIEGEG
ncbi:hypothetical protein [Kluyvera ascorbata]|uniref:hypothetical protein n=1 Tax=Kluyvera ascorbata TaxID=51288 RepID=UPI0028063361|nr:hypothetical protein [Kluyvera ascorbata]MDU3911564.1 hypothetical protein [Kluyvera ascorbata]